MKTSNFWGGRSARSIKALCMGTTAFLAIGTFNQVEAQDAGDDEIVVTGSRIPQDPNLTASVPVQSIDEDTIRLSGEVNLADIVNDIPALVSSLTAENSVTGANALNLRGLDAERTLTLVNGRRHVAGFRGSASVDTGSIPRALVKNVEVSTGGASAVYGADAVTGVVNFILKDDFEGLEVNASTGISTQGDAENYSIDATWGKNFDNGRGNIVLSASYTDDSNITYGDRDWSRNNGIAVTQANPALRIQPGELGADTPNFNNIFGTFGGLILSGDFTGLTLTAAEQALVDRATNAPSRIVLEDPRFWLTSQEGSVAPGFGGRGVAYVDLNNNGVPDCQESRGGQTGFLAGCWVTDANGNARVFQEGLIASGGLWGTGGDGGRLNFDRDTLFPETDTYNINLNGKYELSPNVTAFFEGKYVNAESSTFGEQDTFYDTLWIQADNPYIPTALQPVANQVGYLLLTQDPLDFSDNNPTVNERETMRFVGGLEWQTDSGHNFEFSVNHGEFKNTQDTSTLLLDRQFAALDAVRDPISGEIVCRSDLDPNAFYEIDYFSGGNGYANGDYFSNRYYSFTPGDGQCRPANPFGTYSVSAEAQDFMTADLQNQLKLKQTVVSLISSGELGFMGDMLDGGIGYAAGFEYRRESSDNQLDPLTLGILPQGSSLTPGAFVGDIDPWLNSFTSIDNDRQFNTGGSYDVREVFGEVRVPVFKDQTFFNELTLDAAVRYADYSTSGGATTWKVGGTWAPVEDLSVRSTLSKAVRAANITELFDPELPIQIAATADPCDPGNVGTGPDPATRQANCVAGLQAAGVALSDILDGSGNYIWNNPLTGRFSGVSGGNPNLEPETADTFTVGAVIRPRFVDGLSLTVDYWDIKIEDAISAVGSNEILRGCHDSTSFPNLPFCNQFTRRADGGLNFLRSGEQNFAKLEAKGVDFAANYSFDMGENTFGARLVGSYQDRLDRFFDPNDLTAVNPELQEIQSPELSGNLLLSWERGPAALGFQTSYQSKQAVDEIEDVLAGDYGNAGFYDETFIFDVNGSYEISESLSIYGGVNNIADEEPFSIETAWPVGPRGRYVFAGITYRR